MRPNIIDHPYQKKEMLAVNTTWDERDFNGCIPEKVIERLNNFLMKGCRVTINVTFPVWKTVKLGIHKSQENIRNGLKKKGFRISDEAVNIMSKSAFTIASNRTTIDIVNVSLNDLGLWDCATLKQICTSAAQLNLSLCPAEIGPQLRLQYPDQKENTWLNVAMEPITDSDGKGNIFSMIHDRDGYWLCANWGYPDGTWDPIHDRFVFALCK